MAVETRRSRAGRGWAIALLLAGLQGSAAAGSLQASSIPRDPATTAPLNTPSAAPAAGAGAAGDSPEPSRGVMGMGSSDQRFIVMMIPHHQGAIAMAELALSRSRNPEILALAQRIRTGQSREIAQMRQWYRQWYGGEVPSWRLEGRDGMGMSHAMGMGMGLPGMAISLEALRRTREIDRVFIEQMIPHHRMGVMMASHAQWNSRHPQLRALEGRMVQVQSREIEQMARWYRQWIGASGRSQEHWVATQGEAE